MVRLHHYVTVLIFIILLSLPSPALSEDKFDLLEMAFRAHRQEEYDKSIELYSKLIRSRSLKARERAICYLLRGEVYRDKGEPKRAIDDFTRAIRIRKNYAQAFYFRGLTNEKEGDFESALADIQKAVELRPDKEVYRNRLNIVRAKLGKPPIEDAKPVVKEEKKPDETKEEKKD